MNTLEEIVEFYGSDKNKSGYTPTYTEIFSPIREEVTSVLEIGIGTLDYKYPSTFGGNTRLYPHYKPGGSLRTWRDFFTRAEIYGIDIADDCMFEDERITTFQFDSSDSEKCDVQLRNLKFNIIIDDGNHDPKYQIKTLRNLFKYLKQGGYYIIEDIGGYGGTEQLLLEYLDEFNELTQGQEVINKGNHIVIKKKLVGVKNTNIPSKNVTIVTGLWDINREGRGFEEHYLPNFEKLLKIDIPMVLFIPKSLETFVRDRRSENNTYIRITELEDVKRMYSPFWDRTQNLRISPDWYNITGEGGWLKTSPQAQLEWYNPIVMSKMFFLHDASIWNVFGTDYIYWLDAGITNTVSLEYFTKDRILDKLPEYSDPFLFISYPYKPAGEVHGFKQDVLFRIIGRESEYVCRGGLFGGKREYMSDVNGDYYTTLDSTLSLGVMGTEETIFTIMSYRNPAFYKRFMLAGSLIGHFADCVRNNTVILEDAPVPAKNVKPKITERDLKKIKTNLYILTFNFPDQLKYTLDRMKLTSEWLSVPKIILIDNSTNEEAIKLNAEIAKEHNFEHIITGENKGICGGRQIAAEHFDKSDADFMFFFEDDMGLNPAENDIPDTVNNDDPKYSDFCRNGFRKFIPNLYFIVHKIMLRENFDFLKLSFTEVYLDNNKQCSWYNVPQTVRSRDWPYYDKLPISGLDPNTPLTKFENIDSVDGVSYATGEVYYCNWPMIVSKEGNKKMFIDTKWAHPFEQTWMSHMYNLTKDGVLKPAVLLCSPIWHERIFYYEPEERREN